MARRRRDDPVDLTQAHELTQTLIASLACPLEKTQAFLRDEKSPSLRVRVTRQGAKSFVFEAKLNRQTIRRTIGDVRSWRIDDARQEANRLRVLVDTGADPRAVAKERAALVAKEAAKGVTLAEVWPRYLAEGKPKRKAAWKPRYLLDLQRAAAPGGEPKKRGHGVTKPGHLAALMPLPLSAIDQDMVREWYAREAKSAPVQAARAVAMLSGFLGWCATRRDLRELVHKEAARASELGDMLPGVQRRRDALEASQLPGWFEGTNKLTNRTAATYLQVLLFTGARREELAALTWENVDFKWRKMTIADKVDATRVIPLTPYVASLLASLPKGDGVCAPYVFSSPRSRSGRIAEPRSAHSEVLKDAGIPHVSIHGLRRSFSLLGEAAGAPAGAIAQIMGHRPSAVAEGYRPRSIDALRGYAEQIETFILVTAGLSNDGVSSSTNSKQKHLTAV